MTRESSFSTAVETFMTSREGKAFVRMMNPENCARMTKAEFDNYMVATRNLAQSLCDALDNRDKREFRRAFPFFVRWGNAILDGNGRGHPWKLKRCVK